MGISMKVSLLLSHQHHHILQQADLPSKLVPPRPADSFQVTYLLLEDRKLE